MKMFFPICLAMAAMSSLFASQPVMKRLGYGRDWVYQPILINGEKVFQSRVGNAFEQRYETIKQILSRIDGPFTVLDLGANNGYFSLRIAHDFDAVCVLVDGTERLSDICTLNTDTNRLIHIQKYFKKNDIRELARREHFDVVLALHVLHHVDDWMTWVNTLFELGDEVIIETPSVNDPINQFPRTKQLAIYLTSLSNGVEIGRFPRKEDFDHMLWFSQRGRSTGRVGILPSTFLHLSTGGYPKKSYVEELNRKFGTDKWVLQGIDYTPLR
ncbi:MAG: methyltransferase domain-containing protein [Chlamydiales bacterium]